MTNCPKMKILPSFPHITSNVSSFLEIHLKKSLHKMNVSVLFWTPLPFINWTKTVLQNIFFCILQKKVNT